jgi:hypothetical protein
MQDEPNPNDLLEAVIRFLRDVALPQLDARAAFDARIAANLLRIAQRETALAPATRASELERLRVLLGQEGDDVGALNRTLCECIADGRIAANDQKLIGHLWAATLAKLAVDQPNHSTYQRVLAAAASPSPGDSI